MIGIKKMLNCLEHNFHSLKPCPYCAVEFAKNALMEIGNRVRFDSLDCTYQVAEAEMGKKAYHKLVAMLEEK